MSTPLRPAWTGPRTRLMPIQSKTWVHHVCHYPPHRTPAPNSWGCDLPLQNHVLLSTGLRRTQTLTTATDTKGSYTKTLSGTGTTGCLAEPPSFREGRGQCEEETAEATSVRLSVVTLNVEPETVVTRTPMESLEPRSTESAILSPPVSLVCLLQVPKAGVEIQM